MRNLAKSVEPPILEANNAQWTAEFLADQDNATAKYRYRCKEIKEALKQETGWKCIYCESKIGHNTPGDVEHKIPTSIVPQRHFEWQNLSVACGECNRRKNNYYDAIKPFLDPYQHDVDTRVKHHGPVVGWTTGDNESELTIRILDLHNATRDQLLKRKIEKIEEINNLCSRILNEAGTELAEILKADLQRRMDRSEEYSGMVKSLF